MNIQQILFCVSIVHLQEIVKKQFFHIISAQPKERKLNKNFVCSHSKQNFFSNFKMSLCKKGREIMDFLVRRTQKRVFNASIHIRATSEWIPLGFTRPWMIYEISRLSMCAGWHRFQVKQIWSKFRGWKGFYFEFRGMEACVLDSGLA